MNLKTINKTFFLCLFVVLFNFPLVGQLEWIPGTSWEYRTWIFNSYGEYNSANFSITKDTIVDNKNCVILEREFYSCTQRPLRDIIYQQEHEIFYYHLGDSTFYQLYNFDAQLGDTLSLRLWDGHDNNVDYTYFMVDSIGSVNFDGSSLKKFYLNVGYLSDDDIVFYDGAFFQFELIEGIGCLTNLFYFFDDGVCDGRYVDEFWCFSHPEEGVYVNGESPCGFIETGTEIIQEEEVLVFPNPVTDMLYFSRELDAETIRIYDQAGRLVHQQPFESQISTMALNSGIYFLQLYSDNKVSETKFVIGK